MEKTRPPGFYTGGYAQPAARLRSGNFQEADQTSPIDEGCCSRPRVVILGTNSIEEETMARYGKAAGKSVKSAVHRAKSGTLRSGKGGKGGRVRSRKQAIAIGLSEARKKGAKVPAKA